MQKFTLNNENIHRKATDYLSMTYSHSVTANNLQLKRCISRFSPMRALCVTLIRMQNVLCCDSCETKKMRYRFS